MIIINYEKCCWKDGKCSNTKEDGTCDCGGGHCCTETSGGCMDVCPSDAITRQDKLIIDPELCLECELCIDECPKGALSSN